MIRNRGFIHKQMEQEMTTPCVVLCSHPPFACQCAIRMSRELLYNYSIRCSSCEKFDHSLYRTPLVPYNAANNTPAVTVYTDCERQSLLNHGERSESLNMSNLLCFFLILAIVLFGRFFVTPLTEYTYEKTPPWMGCWRKRSPSYANSEHQTIVELGRRN